MISNFFIDNYIKPILFSISIRTLLMAGNSVEQIVL